MISRQSLGLVIGIAAAGCVAASVGDDHPIRDAYFASTGRHPAGLTNELCLNGQPRKRPPACDPPAFPQPSLGGAGCISYGGLRERHGFERDHFFPVALCRGQTWCDVAVLDPNRPPSATNPGNVWYQGCYRFGNFRCVEGPAANKDAQEFALIHTYCSGRISLPDAYAQIRKDWGGQ